MEYKKIKIFSSPSWLPEKTTSPILLTQLTLGRYPEESIYQGLGRFEAFFRDAPSFIEWVERPEDAELLLIPSDYKQYKKSGRLDIIDNVITLGKKIRVWPIIQYKDDGDDELKYDRIIVLRTSFYKSRRKTNEYAMPVWSEDIGKYYNIDLSKVSRDKPAIGFTGMASHLKGWTRTLFGVFIRCAILTRYHYITYTKRFSASIRNKFLSILESDSRITTHFLIRDGYLGGSWKSKGIFDMELYKTIRLEYINNLREVDYVADFRGGGNYSLRLYETLCAGRIPFMLDSERVLPLDELIDWDQHLIRLPLWEINKSGNYLANHYHIHQHQIEQMKIANRKLWENYLAPEKYYFHLFSVLRKKYCEDRAS